MACVDQPHAGNSLRPMTNAKRTTSPPWRYRYGCRRRYEQDRRSEGSRPSQGPMNVADALRRGSAISNIRCLTAEHSVLQATQTVSCQTLWCPTIKSDSQQIDVIRRRRSQLGCGRRGGGYSDRASSARAAEQRAEDGDRQEQTRYPHQSRPDDMPDPSNLGQQRTPRFSNSMILTFGL